MQMSAGGGETPAGGRDGGKEEGGACSRGGAERVLEVAGARRPSLRTLQLFLSRPAHTNAHAYAHSRSLSHPDHFSRPCSCYFGSGGDWKNQDAQGKKPVSQVGWTGKPRRLRRPDRPRPAPPCRSRGKFEQRLHARWLLAAGAALSEVKF